MVLGHTLAAGRCGAPGPPSAPVTCILKITELTPTGGGDGRAAIGARGHIAFGKLRVIHSRHAGAALVQVMYGRGRRSGSNMRSWLTPSSRVVCRRRC